MSDKLLSDEVLAEFDALPGGATAHQLRLVKRISALEQRPSAPSIGWIPVSERLPEVEQRVVLLNMAKPMAWLFTWFRGNTVVRDGNVTHWMPLPNPPAIKAAAERVTK